MSGLALKRCEVRPTWVEPGENDPGTWEILGHLSDGTLATPMGGNGFPDAASASQAINRVTFDGDQLVVAPETSSTAWAETTFR